MQEQVIDYRRIDPAIEARVEELLARMTLAEKVGQLVQMMPFKPFDVAEFLAQQKQAEAAGQPFQFRPEPRPDLEDLIRSGSVGSLLNLPDPQLIDRYQRVAVEQSRLGIPLIIGADVIHGYRTVFPIPLAESCTWDPALLERAARVAAEEASAAGIDWIFAPMVDVGRDPRWGRVAEGAGEDSFLGCAMARARVRGFQSADLVSGRRVAACPKHYLGYGAAEAGRDYNTVDLSERTLREVYLPPFKAAFEAGAGSVMSSFNEIGGLPATADPWLLRTILRDEWGWPGVVLSDYEAVRELIPHGLAGDLRDAARLSILAGLDMDMVSGAYATHLADLVDSGAVPLALVDEVVRRVLRLKIGLGLFERWGVDSGLAERIVLRDDFRALALQVARQSIVLLKNAGDLLPLAPGGQRIAVIGPLAENRRDLLGAWAINGQPEDVETLLEGMRAYVSDDMLTYLQGCSIDGADPVDLAAAVAVAQAADVVVLALGEGADMSGEAHSRAHLGLPGRQQELLDALAQTGKPIVGVVFSGRPLVIPRMAEQAGAILAAWHGGIRAGRAIADVLFGAANPSGKLTAGWPRAEGQIPLYYAHKNTGRPAAGAGTKQFAEPFKSVYMDEPNSPLFPFGHGLSYTRFEYRELRVETPVVGLDGTLVASVVIQNTGDRSGAEVAQLYVRDLVGSVTRPVKQLKGFQRITLAPGESNTLRFEVDARELGFWGPDMRYIVEPGAFKLWVGPDSQGGLEGDFEVQAG
ncbi:MAG TPA: glycoside hydrolase family 3 N-terminal domain-containing protein [Roseiflexaceae bacterium]|nr:glycoside hydrolase family 3 N-terminal domain-containing protein [Roseiflexaceae bacterium]